jgi:hypothetical protein
MLKHKDIQTEKDVKSLVKNYNLLRIVEKIESRKSQINTQQSYASERKSNYIDISNKLLSNSEKKLNKNEKTNICKLHNSSILYYNISNNALLCETCIKGTNINFSPLPSVRNAFK